MNRLLHLVVAGLCLVGMWLYVNRVLIAHEISESQRLGTPRGNLSDLYPRWLGARELLLHHRDPYSREVTLDIQEGYYGRVLDPSRPHDPADQQAFAYPIYTAFLLAPITPFSFSAVQAAFFWVLAGITILSVLLWLLFVQWRPNWIGIAVLLQLTLGSFAVVQGLKLQQLSLLVAFLLATALMCVSAERFVAAGILLAFATIKPQLSLLVIAWLLGWAIFGWRKRSTLIISFVACLGVLIAAGELLLPGWIPEFYAATRAYRRYTPAGSSFERILPHPFVIPLIALLTVSLMVVCWKTRNCGPHDSAFLLTTSLVLAVTLLLIPMMAPYNQMLLLPGILFLARDWRQLWGRSFAGRVLLASVALPLAWAWASAIVLALASFFTFAPQNLWQLPLWTSVVLPIPVVACLAMLTFRVVLAPMAASRPSMMS